MYADSNEILQLQAAGPVPPCCPIAKVTSQPPLPMLQVINAARVLASKPKSKPAQENMEVFRAAWENQVSPSQ